MTDAAAGRSGAVHSSRLTTGTLVASAVAVAIAQIGLSMPAVLNGMFQQDLGTTSTQLTWISDAFLVPSPCSSSASAWSATCSAADACSPSEPH